MDHTVLKFDNIRQEFLAPRNDVRDQGARRNFIHVDAGKFVAVIGPSGCGKSTLLQMAAGLLIPTHGRVSHREKPILGINTEIGFVPQQAQLFPWKTLVENVECRACCAGFAVECRDRDRWRMLEADRA